MKINHLLGVLQRFSAQYGDVEVGVIESQGSPIQGTMDAAMATVETPDGMRLVCIISQTRLQCEIHGCPKCKAGKPH